MKLTRIELQGYKCYRSVSLDLAPLTIFVGPNNSGKSTLGKAILLLAGGLLADRETEEPLPMRDIRTVHAGSFEDLLHGRVAHGRLHIKSTFTYENSEIELWVVVQNVKSIGPTYQVVTDWSLSYIGNNVSLTRNDLKLNSDYALVISTADGTLDDTKISWRGILPSNNHLPGWATSLFPILRDWASHVTYLESPRRLRPSPFECGFESPRHRSSDGENTPLFLAHDQELFGRVRDWYKSTFGVGIEISQSGNLAFLLGPNDLPLAQSGQGLSQIFPVVTLALTTSPERARIDVIEHPEGELHPDVHGAVADLLYEQAMGGRTLLIETHSEMLLLRARRWVAEGKLSPDKVAIYWVENRESKSTITRISISRTGGVDAWPEGVFGDPYDEIMAIRRAAHE